MRLSKFLLGALLCVPVLPIAAQPPGPPPGAEAPPAGDVVDGSQEDAGDQGAPSSPAAPRKLGGDVITFKTGRVLSGVQVLREGVTGVEIQVVQGIPPLKIPRDQIESIEYDELVASQGGTSSTSATSPPGVVIAQELSPELSRKLAVPLAEEDLNLEGAPVLQTLTALSVKMEVPLQIGEAVQQMDASQLVWRSNPAPGSTFSSLLQDNIVKAYPELALVYEYDQIILTSRAALAPGVPDDAPVGVVEPVHSLSNTE